MWHLRNGVKKMPYVPDNSDLFASYDVEQEARLRKMPVCCRCKEHIQQPEAVKVNGRWFCEDCEDHAWEVIRKDFLESTKE